MKAKNVTLSRTFEAMENCTKIPNTNHVWLLQNTTARSHIFPKIQKQIHIDEQANQFYEHVRMIHASGCQSIGVFAAQLSEYPFSGNSLIN